MVLPIEQWYFEIPPVTRIYGTCVVLITVACQLHLVSPLQLYFNYKRIIFDRQYWRLITHFLFFGHFGIDFLFHMFFMIRYCRSLEEGSFRGRQADFLWLMILGAILMTIIAPFSELLFMSQSLNYMLVYIWARRNPDVRMNFMGFVNFDAPYLPWFLMGFSLFLHNSIPIHEVIGAAVGHLYYFFDDVYPVVSRTGKRYLRAPMWLKRLVETGPQDLNLQQPIVENEEHPHHD